MQLTVLDGSTFCISDERGDIVAAADGLFAADTRYLSRLVLTLGGERPLLLTSRATAFAEASFVLRNPTLPGLASDTLAVLRGRTVAGGLRERIELRNLTERAVAVSLEVELACDFADIFTVKQHDFGLGGDGPPAPLPVAAELELRDGGRELRFADTDSSGAELQVVLSEPATAIDRNRIVFAVELGSREHWRLELQIIPSAEGELGSPAEAGARLEAGRRSAADSLATWEASVPNLNATWVDLDRSYRQAVRDIAALRMRFGSSGELIAAGLPWFMTVFGRDTLIASLQTLPLGADLSRSALLALAELQADADDPEIDAEPGKILHEVRRGKAAQRWFARYYGTVDATPLFLVLLSEYWRWTRDDALIQQLQPNALRALAWIEQADQDGDGFVEYERRTEHGIENQTWKDSHDSQLFHDGTRARGAIAAAEIQGYVYDAKLRTAELARVVWGDPTHADRLEREAEELRVLFDAAFWCERTGGWTYALALDGEKRPVNALTSNIGHLLWSGIVPEERVDVIAQQLLGDELWSGWGVRTMASGDRGYNPLAYHDGTVWPHDNSVIAWGLARAGRRDDALRIVRAMLEAASYFEYQLPEVFAGFARSELTHPIVYPTASRPQAWAAGTVVLLLRLLLGLEPDPAERRLVTTAPAGLPDWLGTLRLEQVPAFGATWTATLESGAVEVWRD